MPAVMESMMAKVTESMVAKVSMMTMSMTEAKVDARPPAITPVIIRGPVRIPIPPAPTVVPVAVVTVVAVAPMAMAPADLLDRGIGRPGTVR